MGMEEMSLRCARIGMAPAARRVRVPCFSRAPPLCPVPQSILLGIAAMSCGGPARKPGPSSVRRTEITKPPPTFPWHGYRSDARPHLLWLDLFMPSQSAWNEFAMRLLCRPSSRRSVVRCIAWLGLLRLTTWTLLRRNRSDDKLAAAATRKRHTCLLGRNTQKSMNFRLFKHVRRRQTNETRLLA
jgi:hypothetical protein